MRKDTLMNEVDMDTILKQITDKIRDVESGNFESFVVSEAVKEVRQQPVDSLPLLEEGFFVIAESKKGSPSKGIIRQHYDPQTIAAAYQRAGASAISVITEKYFFFGEKHHLTQVKKIVDLPVLRKDFIIHPYQVYESYNLGADIILLIAACLTDDEMATLYRLSLALGMRVLLEVHNKEELDRALQIEPQIIGINNRDLKTFEVDMGTSFRLKEYIPEGIHVISESGISRAEDIVALKRAGFAGALIGESLLRQDNLEDALRKVKGSASGGSAEG